MTTRAGGYIAGLVDLLSSAGETYRKSAESGNAMNLGYTAPTGSTQKYKNQGYYVAGSVYETWVSTTPGGAPPSGHTLTNIQFTPLQG